MLFFIVYIFTTYCTFFILLLQIIFIANCKLKNYDKTLKTIITVMYVLTCGSLNGALIRTMHRPIRPVQRIQPTEFLMVRLHPT